MPQFTTNILKFGKQGEKTGWTYIIIPIEAMRLLFRRNRKAFRVKGRLDQHWINRVAVLPVKDGTFIMPINATMRKALKKKEGDPVYVEIYVDNSKLKLDKDLVECLKDEHGMLVRFMCLTQSQQGYFNKWITAAKNPETKANRIADTVNAMIQKMNYPEMLRERKRRLEF